MHRIDGARIALEVHELRRVFAAHMGEHPSRGGGELRLGIARQQGLKGPRRGVVVLQLLAIRVQVGPEVPIGNEAVRPMILASSALGAAVPLREDRTMSRRLIVWVGVLAVLGVTSLSAREAAPEHLAGYVRDRRS